MENFKHLSKLRQCLIFILVLAIYACNKDDVIEDTVGKAPIITLDSEDGIYTVKTGKTLTISPDVENATDAKFSWTIDGNVVSQSATLSVTFDKPQILYVIFHVENQAGSAQEEIKIEVLELTPPVISFALPEGGLKAKTNTEYIFTPDIQHSDQNGFKIEWIRNGEVVSEETTYVFCEPSPGVYPITIKASNDDGEDIKEFDVEVLESLPYKLSFPSQSYYQPITDRTTIVGRTIYLTPLLEYFENPEFSWSVNDEIISEAHERTYKFTPDKPGDYTVTVCVASVQSNQSVNIPTQTNNISEGKVEVRASVIVHCFAKETEYIRHGGSSAFMNNVYEYLPAPGQFVNETKTAGFNSDITTLEKANEYALERLKKKNYVSLGGWGGYIVVGFDHSIINTESDYDFAIQGNAFNSANGGSNEPGIVYVMQDTNGNGLPDDEWYELRGSETGAKGTIQDYWCTYFRPAAPKMDVTWIDSEGNTGKIAYLGMFHPQDYYYPLWINAESYTLYGTRLVPNNSQDPTTGYWANNALAWGYADNIGSDCLSSDSADGNGQMNGFKISNAMQPDGTPIRLSHIDFIKVQTGVNAQSGAIGENSTEVFSFLDLNRL